MFVHDERLYHWNFLESHFEHYDIHLTCAWLIWGDIPPRPTFPFVIYSGDSELNPLTTIYSSSDHPTLSAKAQGRIYNLSPYPYNAFEIASIGCILNRIKCNWWLVEGNKCWFEWELVAFVMLSFWQRPYRSTRKGEMPWRV